MRGLAALGRGETSSPEALLVQIASERLRELGFLEDREIGPTPEPELRLYGALASASEDPSTRYRALRGELQSFLEAAEARKRWTVAGSGPSGNSAGPATGEGSAPLP